MLTAGGATITSRSRPSRAASRSRSLRSAPASACDSAAVRFIFQFPAISNRRIDESVNGSEPESALERFDAGQHQPFEIFERCAAAGRDMSKATCPRRVSDRRGRVAAADEAFEALVIGDCLADLQSAPRELRQLEIAERS